MSMVLLDSADKVIYDLLTSLVVPELNPMRLEEKVADLDGASYKISTPVSKTVVLVSLHWPCYGQLETYGAREIVAREYGSLVIQAEQGYHVTLQVDLEKLPQSAEDKLRLLHKISLLKRNVLAAPFERAFEAQSKGIESPTMAVNYRDLEAIYVKALADRVTVVFSTTFKEETDKVFGKVFLQEFVDARRQPSIQNAPQVLYSPKEPPLEVKGLVRENDEVGFVTFVLFPRHFATGPAREECISRIQLFRDYFHYHIKCSKAYMHSRMRARVDSFLKVLNRAKPEKQDASNERKTFTGKTFVRQRV